MRAARLIVLVVLALGVLRALRRAPPPPDVDRPPCPDPVAVAWRPDQERLGCAGAFPRHLEEAAAALGCRFGANPPRPRAGRRVRVVRASDGWCEAAVESLEGPARLALGLPIDLNSARASDLEVLPGIGPARAERIVARRRALGGFDSVERLGEVRGIGPAVLARIRPLVTARRRRSPAPPDRPPRGRSPRRTRRRGAPPGGRLGLGAGSR